MAVISTSATTDHETHEKPSGYVEHEGFAPEGICVGCKHWYRYRIGFFGCPAPCVKEDELRSSFDTEEEWIETMASGLECPLREEE